MESLKLGSDVIKCEKEDNYKNSCHDFCMIKNYNCGLF